MTGSSRGAGPPSETGEEGETARERAETGLNTTYTHVEQSSETGVKRRENSVGLAKGEEGERYAVNIHSTQNQRSC